jgi:hypothetical protein
MKLEFGQYQTANDATYEIFIDTYFNKGKEIHLTCKDNFGSHIWIDVKPSTLIKIIFKFYYQKIFG